jgi:hypothetical protein
VRAFSLSVSHKASAARACTRARRVVSRKVRASSASVVMSEMAVVRRISAIGSSSAGGAFDSVFFAEVFCGVAAAGCCCFGCGCSCASACETAKAETKRATARRRAD